MVSLIHPNFHTNSTGCNSDRLVTKICAARTAPPKDAAPVFWWAEKLLEAPCPGAESCSYEVLVVWLSLWPQATTQPEIPTWLLGLVNAKASHL